MTKQSVISTGFSSSSSLTMSSREIAELTGKRHSDVMRDIRVMLDNLEIEQSAFLRFDNSGANGRRVDFYDLDKELTVTLVTGYNPKMRHVVVQRWIELEDKARTPQFCIPQTYAEALMEAGRLALELIEAEEQLSIAAPKAEVYDLVIEKDHLVTATQIGGKFGMSAQALNKILDDFGVYNKAVKREKTFKKWFIESGYGEIKLYEEGYSHSLFTNKGEMWVIECLRDEGFI